jgi:hypothetical protein
VFLLTGLTVNTYLASQIQRPEERVRIPYSPVFLDQVEAGNVKSISSQQATVQGEFRKVVTYPPDEADVEPTHLFVAEVGEPPQALVSDGNYTSSTATACQPPSTGSNLRR